MMRIATAAGLTGLALIGLAACSKGGPSAGSPAASASVSSAAPANAAPTSMHSREGLWSETMNIDGMNVASSSQVCIDKAFEEKMVPGAQTVRSKCSAYSMNRQLNGDWVFNSTCAVGRGGVVTTSGTVHGDFDKAYEMDATSTVSGSDIPQMNRTMKMTMQATWLGPCKPGQKGGDVIVNGMKMNMPGGRRVEFNSAHGLGTSSGGG